MSEENGIIPAGKVSFIAGDTRFIIDDRYEYLNLILQSLSRIKIKVKDKNDDKFLTITKATSIFYYLDSCFSILKSLKLNKFLKHDNILSIFSLLLPQSRSNYNHLYIVQDFMESNLSRVIRSKQPLTTDHIQYFLYQVLLALQYLHSSQIIHYNLSPHIILINSDCSIKITEFESALSIHKEYRAGEENYTNRWYSAPELLGGCEYIGYECDIWSVGCILAELIGRQVLFPGNDNKESIRIIVEVLGSPTEEEMEFIRNERVKQFIRNLPTRSKVDWRLKFPNVNRECLDLMDKMMRFNPKERMKAEECLKHPFFASIYDSSDIKTCSQEFDWSFLNIPQTREALESAIYDECLLYS
jgi:mitogen-activated protein kinase 1/3